MTRLEQRYQAFLEEEQRVGRIALWKREPFRFVIESGKRFSYLPDFGVVYADRGMSLIECKPRDKKNGKALWIYEDSRVKTKAVAAAFRGWPWKLIVTWPLRDGTWGREEL